MNIAQRTKQSERNLNGFLHCLTEYRTNTIQFNHSAVKIDPICPTSRPDAPKKPSIAGLFEQNIHHEELHPMLVRGDRQACGGSGNQRAMTQKMGEPNRS